MYCLLGPVESVGITSRGRGPVTQGANTQVPVTRYLLPTYASPMQAAGFWAAVAVALGTSLIYLQAAAI